MQTSLLLHTFARRGKPMTFTELALALQGTGATISELVAALSAALHDQMIVPCGFAEGERGALGPRLLELSERGRAAVAADRVAVA